MTLWFPHWSGPVGWIEDFLLGHWPEGDEDAMRRLSKHWSDMSAALTELKDPADKAMSSALTAIDGKTHDAMSTYWQDIAGGDGSDLNSVITMCDNFAKQLEQGATDIEHAKIVMYISVATMIAMAFVPGIGEAFDAVASAAVKVVIRKTAQELIDKLAIKGATALAERTGLKIATKVATKVALKTTEKGAQELGEGAAAKFVVSTMAQAAVGGALGGATDLAANVVQAAEGEDVDFNSSWTAAGAGAIAGTVGGVVSHPSNAAVAKIAQKVDKNVDLGTNSAKAVVARGVAAVPGNVLGNTVSTVATGGTLDQGVLDGAGGGLGRVKPENGGAVATPHVDEASHSTPHVDSHDTATTPSAAHSDSATQTTTASDSSASNADTSSKPASVAAADNASATSSSGGENASSAAAQRDSVAANSTQDSRPTAASEAQQSAPNNAGPAASDRASTQNPAAQGTTAPNTDRAATPASAGNQAPTAPPNRDAVSPADRSAPANTSRPAADAPQRPDSTQRPDAVQRPDSTQHPETAAPQNDRSTAANSSAAETSRGAERSSDNTPRNPESTDRTTTSARDAQLREPRPVTEDSGRRASDTSGVHTEPSREAPRPDKPTGSPSDRRNPLESPGRQRDSARQSERSPAPGNSRTPTRDRDSTAHSAEAAERNSSDRRSEPTPDRNTPDRTGPTRESIRPDPQDSVSPTERFPRRDESEVPRRSTDRQTEAGEIHSDTSDSAAADESAPRDTLGSSEDSADDVPPVTEFDNYLENGEGVVYRPNSTSIGDDPRTHRVRENTLNEGEHDVIVHGSPEGAPIPSLGPEVHPEQIVDAILGNPNYEPGTPVRLLSCFSGNDMGWAQHVADRLGVPVRAPSDAVGTARKPNSPAVVRGDGEFVTFHPNSDQAHPGRENPLDPAGQLPDKQPHTSDNRRSAYDDPPGWDFMGGDADSGTRESSLHGLPEQPDRPEAGSYANGLRGLDLPGFESRETQSGAGVSERSEAVEPQREPTTDRSHGDTGSLGNFHGDGRPAGQSDLTRAEVIRAINENTSLVMPDDVKWFSKDQSALMARPGQQPVEVHFNVRPIDGGAVAEFHVREDGATYDVNISPRARDEDIVRALAHEVAEIKLLHDPKISVEPSRDHVDGSTPSLGGRLAEVKVLTAHIERAELDPRRAHELPGLRRDLTDLLDGIGMRDLENSQARWRLLQESDARMVPRLKRQLDRIPASRDLVGEHSGEPHARSVLDERADRNVEVTQHSLKTDETPRRFESPSDGEEFGEQVLGYVRDSLTPDRLEAVRRYVDGSWINDVLRSPDPGGMLDRLIADRKDLEAIMNHISVPEPTYENVRELVERLDLHPDVRAAAERIIGHSQPATRLHEMVENGRRGRHIRESLGGVDPTVDAVADYIRTLDSAVDTPISESMVVVRGLKSVEHLVIDDHGTPLGAGDIQKLRGSVQSEPGALSTALSNRSGFGKYHLELEVPAGTKGLWIGNKNKNGDELKLGGENEFLCERGLKYVITDVVEAPAESGYKHILKGKIVPSDFVLDPSPEAENEAGRSGASTRHGDATEVVAGKAARAESSNAPEVPPNTAESGGFHGSLTLPDPVHTLSTRPGTDMAESADSSVKHEASAESVQAPRPPLAREEASRTSADDIPVVRQTSTEPEQPALRTPESRESVSSPVAPDESQSIPAPVDTAKSAEPEDRSPTEPTSAPEPGQDGSSVQRPQPERDPRTADDSRDPMSPDRSAQQDSLRRRESSFSDPQRTPKQSSRESPAPAPRNPEGQEPQRSVDARRLSDRGTAVPPDRQVPRTPEVPRNAVRDDVARRSPRPEQPSVPVPQRHERPQERSRAPESSRPQPRQPGREQPPTQEHPSTDRAGLTDRQPPEQRVPNNGPERDPRGAQRDPRSVRRDEMPPRGPSQDDVRRAQEARRWRDWLRPYRPDANRVVPVTTKLGPNAEPAFDIRRYSNARGGPVAVARIKVHVTADPNIHPQWLSHLWENTQKATDLGFNRGHRLLSGDRILVDLVHTSDPAEANLHINVGERPGQWRPDMSVDAITRQLRDHLGLLPPDPNHPGLNAHEIRQLSNDVAHANTPARFDNPSESRAIGLRRLDEVERTEYQAAVEDALRDGNRFLVGADPRTNAYGKLINDGGLEVPGRANNCTDCSLSALSAFYGNPQVSAPRWLDPIPGGVDLRSGERGGPERAARWLGDGLHKIGGDHPIPNQFGHLHDLVDRMGPGSSALVVNEWQARDANTGAPLYNPDGTPCRGGLHATVIVYPHDAGGPVWWDPQAGTMSDHPPQNMVYGSTGLWYTPIASHPGETHGGMPHSGTGRGVPGSDLQPGQKVSAVSDRGDRMAGSAGTESGGDRPGRDESGDRRGNRGGDRVSELEHNDDRGRLPGGQGDGPAPRRGADLSAPVAAEHPAHPGNSGEDRIPSPSRVPGESAGGERGVRDNDRQADTAASGVRPESGERGGPGGVAEQAGRELAGTADLGGVEHPDHEPPPLDAQERGDAAGVRESDGTPEEPVAQAGERDSPVAAVEPEELDRIFHEEIVPGLLSDAASVPPSEKPELVVVGGQMGAGKSTMIAEIKASFADRGSVLHLSGDDFFRFHPRYAELMAQHDPDAIRHLVRDSGRWFRMAREHAIANRQHVIVELAMGDPAKEAGIMREFADNGYTARAEVMAVAEPQSRLSTIGRYLAERVDHGVHRYTPPRLHEASFTGSQEMVGHLESADPPVRIEALTIRSRSGVLFENIRGADGQWAHSPRAAEVFAHERGRPWTAEEKRRFQEQLADVRRRIAQLEELRPEESATLTMLGRELRETEARALPWLASDAHDEATTPHHDDDTGPPHDSSAPVTAEAEARHDQARDAQHDVRAQTANQHEYLRNARERDLAEAPPEQHEQIRASYARAHELVDLATASDMASLRVLAVIDEWHPSKGGVVSVNKNLCEALADLGHEVFVRVGHEVTGLEGADKVTLIAPREPDSSVEPRHQLTSDLTGLPTGIDAVIGHSRFSGPAARDIRDGVYPQARLVHIVHMVTDSLGRVQGKPERAEANHGLEADLVSTTDVAVGVGPALAEEAARLASMTGTSPVVHQMIPGIEFFDQIRPPADRQTKRMLVFGRADDPVKGAMQAAKMVKKLNAQGIDVDLIVRGVPEGKLRDQLRLLQRAAGRDVDVRPYTLDREEILADMRDANVVLMPSRAEGFGLVATEAAGAGVPIVVPSTSGAGRFFGDPDLFPSDLTAGMLVEQGYEDPVSVDRWVDVLARQLSDQDAAWDRALDLQQTLRDRQYTWQSAAAALIDATGMVAPREHPAAGIPSDGRAPST